MEVQFVSNAAGEPTAVLVPIKEWERLQQLAAAQQPSRKEQFKEDFREAAREMKRGGGRPVSELLAELDALPNQDA